MNAAGGAGHARCGGGGGAADAADSVGCVHGGAAYHCVKTNASAGNRARVTSMATMYSATRPLMPLLLRQGCVTQQIQMLWQLI